MCPIHSALANLLLQASFPFCGGYVTGWHPAPTPLRPVTMNVNTCLFPLPVWWHSHSLWSLTLAANFKLHPFPLSFSYRAKAAHTWEVFTPGKVRAWSSFVLLAHRKHFFYWLTLIVYKMVKVRLQHPSIKHHWLRSWLVKAAESSRLRELANAARWWLRL